MGQNPSRMSSEIKKKQPPVNLKFVTMQIFQLYFNFPVKINKTL